MCTKAEFDRELHAGDRQNPPVTQAKEACNICKLLAYSYEPSV